MLFKTNGRFGIRKQCVVTKILVLSGLMVVLNGCGDPTAETLDKWEKTEKGPKKLEKMLRSEGDTLGLRVHAAHNLMHLGKKHLVLDVVSSLPSAIKGVFVEKFVERIWIDARIKGAMDVPTSKQKEAKDMLVNLRPHATSKNLVAIDMHLVDWLTHGYYEGRSTSGSWAGSEIIRLIGPKAAPALLSDAQATLLKTSDREGKKKKIGDETLLGLAMSGDSKALLFLLDQVMKTEEEASMLPQRAMAALHKAYFGLPEDKRANPGYLSNVKSELFSIVESKSLRARFVNDAIDLASVMDVSDCLPLFIGMITDTKRVEPYRWIGTQRAIQCGGVKAISPALEALPEDENYEKRKLDKYLWAEILKIEDRKSVARELNRVLESSSWVAQASAIEVLMSLSYGPLANENVKKISMLKGETRVLRGWKDGQSKRKTIKKREPTLGEIATEAVALLERVANQG